MAYSPFLRSVAFWGSFLIAYKYASRDAAGRQNYPSYAIFKEKILRDTLRDGFEGDKLKTDLGHFSTAAWQEFKDLFR